MKKILPLLLVCLVLAGCTQTAGLSGEPTQPEVFPPTQPVSGLYDPSHSLERETGGAVRCYPLDTAGNNRLYSMGDTLVLFRGGSRIETYTGDALHLEDTVELPLPDLSLRVTDTGISYYDDLNRESVLLDRQLRVVRQIAAPDGLVGVPLLSADGKTLYYCTASAIRALDTDSGLSRVLKETEDAAVKALLLEETVLQCQLGSGKNVFISTENGLSLGQTPGSAQVETFGGSFYASFRDMAGWGAVELHTFGPSEGEAGMLNTDETFLGFLPRQNRAATWQYRGESSEVEISLYDLSGGRRVSALTLPQYITPRQAVDGPDGKVYLLLEGVSENGDVVCLWDPKATPAEDPETYTVPYASPDAPDKQGMEECSGYAQELSRRMGITILVGEEAVDYQPSDYRLQAEYLPSVTRRELKRLEDRLGNFPQGFLATLAENFDGLNICLVRSIVGSGSGHSLDAAAGLQYWKGSTVYLALCTAEDTERSLYHELCHLMDTQVMNNSSAYDTWDKFNPTDFSYDNDYVQNRSRDGSKYLTPGSEAFIDTYSMSFPKEDRARILEYAMTPGHEDIFRSSILQSKLKQICTGIREGFGLTGSTETFLWEQYLWKT